MKFLLDANLSWKLSSKLKEHFGECVHADNVSELEFPAKDSKIWKYAKENGYCVITQDNDFANLLILRRFPPKIILLKTGNCSNIFIADLLIRSKQVIENFLLSEQYGLLEIF